MTNIPRYAASLLLLSTIPLSNTGLAAGIHDIPSYTLRYAVSFQENSLGEVEIAIKNPGRGHVVVRGETFPNALANMFGDGKVIETVEYTEHGNVLRLDRLTEEKGRKNPVTRNMRVDHRNERLLTDRKQFMINNNDQIDAYSFPLLSILGLSDNSDGQEVQLVSASKVHRYRNLPSTHETIVNQAGSFKTLKRSKTRLNNSRTIELWLTESKPTIPVQIQVNRDDGQQILISLISIQE